MENTDAAFVSILLTDVRSAVCLFYHICKKCGVVINLSMGSLSVLSLLCRN